LKTDEKILIPLFVILIPVIIGFIIWWTLQQPVSAITITLLLSILSLSINMHFGIKNNHNNLKEILGIKSLCENKFMKENCEEMAIAYQEVLDKKNLYFNEQAIDIITKCKTELSQLKEGHIIIKKDQILGKKDDLIKKVEKSLCATSLDILYPAFWDPSHGEKYKNEHISALHRGVNITRIFILENLETLENGLKNEISTQIDFANNNKSDSVSNSNMGKFEVKIVTYKKLTDNSVPIKDFGIWDEKLVFYINANPDKNMRDADVYINDEEIKNAKTLWKTINLLAKPADEFLPSRKKE
jgi:hypothetical protein